MLSSTQVNQIRLLGYHMLKYQQNNNITRKCVDNTQYMYDSLVNSGIKAKVKPVMCMSEKSTKLWNSHLVIILEDGTYVDPSYEVVQNKDIKYFDHISCLFETVCLSRENKKKIVKKFLEIINISEKINNGELMITDYEYYENQANYVDENIKKNIEIE